MVDFFKHWIRDLRLGWRSTLIAQAVTELTSAVEESEKITALIRKEEL